MRWSLLLHLLLNALLLAQQPAVTRWEEAPFLSSTPCESGGQVPGEEERQALLSPRGFKLEALEWSQPDERPLRLEQTSNPDPDPRCCETAEAHWREALLPCRSPLDDELRAARRAL